ncbi:hypothetical protein [Nocardioides sp.]|uniref:hypothetical protein n=1 Tax=Nocardioides sp. TaxID=35761 RepID=UPI0039E3D1EF
MRRGFPIHAYIGANGGGKSLAAVYDTLPTLAAGRPVLSTVRILDPATGEPHPLWQPLDDYRTLLEAEFCDVILDEVTGVASSRESAGMPAAVANHLVQLRRRDIALRWTAPSWKRADTIIRECSQGVTLCMGFVPEPVKDKGGDRLWRSRRLFYWRTYDAATFDEWTTFKKEKIKPVARQLMWRPGSMAEAAYDTFDAVLSLGVVTDAGTCMECGGHRRRASCTCEPRKTESRQRRIVGDSTVTDPLTIVIPETDDTPSVAVELPVLADGGVLPVVERDGAEVASG